MNLLKEPKNEYTLLSKKKIILICKIYNKFISIKINFLIINFN